MNFSFPSKIPFHYKIAMNYGNFHQSVNPDQLPVLHDVLLVSISMVTAQVKSTSLNFGCDFGKAHSDILQKKAKDWRRNNIHNVIFFPIFREHIPP